MALIGTVSVELFATSRAATDFDAVFIYAMLGDRVLSFPTCCPVGELAAQGGIAHRRSLADALVCADPLSRSGRYHALPGSAR